MTTAEAETTLHLWIFHNGIPPFRVSSPGINELAIYCGSALVITTGQAGVDAESKARVWPVYHSADLRLSAIDWWSHVRFLRPWITILTSAYVRPGREI
jgi:hypothetical protein